jgi:hypothetical protein
VPAYALGGLMLLHAHANAITQLRGSATDTFPVPFAGNASLSVPPGVLQVPGTAAISALADRLETDRFRAVIVSAPDGYPSYGAPSERGHPAHVAQFWRLRLLDGYPTLPRRLADLPWPESSRSLRALSFPRAETLPWPLLAALNVKYAVVASPELLLNAPSAGDFAPSDDIAARIQVLENPLQPVPRVFFARRVASDMVALPSRFEPVSAVVLDAAPLALVPLGRPEPPPSSCGVVEFGRVEPPCGVNVQALGFRAISVSWQPLTNPEAVAVVDIASSTDRPLGAPIPVPAGEQSHVVTGLRPNTIYRVRVRTCLNDACSLAGAVQQVTLGSSLSADELDGRLPPDPVAESWVSGGGEPREFEVTSDDTIRAEFGQDHVSLALTPASTPRFLVLNELYHPRWRAYAGDRELHILPTNKVMRGLLVPPGVWQIELQFVPFSRTWAAAALATAGVFVGLSGVLALGWLDRRRAPAEPPRA